MRHMFKIVAGKLPNFAVLGLTAAFAQGCAPNGHYVQPTLVQPHYVQPYAQPYYVQPRYVQPYYGGYSGYDARGPYVTTPRFLVPPRSWRQPVIPQHNLQPFNRGYAQPPRRRW